MSPERCFHIKRALMGFEDNKAFAEWLKERTMNFAVEVIKFCEEGLPDSQATKVITYQLIKAATSTASNYRAACRARSGREFFAKLSIAVEEADESHCWLEMIKRLGTESNKEKLEWLLNEAKEITAILAKSRKTAGEKNSNTK